MTRVMLAAGVALGAIAGGGAMWALGGAGDRPAIERTVHAYLLAHPEVIPEAMGRLQERDNARTVAAERAAIETPVGSAWAGNPQGDVTAVEFFDYNCGYCRASVPVVDQLIASDSKLRIVYRELPVLAESSRAAARVSLLAAEQGRFARFHQALYAAGPVGDASIAAAARDAGVDLSRLPAATPRADAAIHASLRLAAQLGMTGTPSWVIGDRVIVGALPLEKLQEAVAQARAR